ncbi:MAG: hypothetical protein JSV88_13325, partial [Candidatus Aminicenantes bacterium]
GCSTVYLKQPFKDFSDSTKKIGKNTTYCFEQLFAEEINTRIAESLKKETINSSLLEPNVLTWTQLELRKEFINYLVNYTDLLESIIIKDYTKDISKNAQQVKKNIETIYLSHIDPLKKRVSNLSFSIYSALAETLTASARRAFILKIMNQHQPILEIVIEKLKQELETTQVLINNFFDRQFLYMVCFRWPAKESSREKYAKIGAKILKRKREINSMLKEVIHAVELIPRTHQQLIKLVKDNQGPGQTLYQLINAGARLAEMLEEFSNEKK